MSWYNEDSIHAAAKQAQTTTDIFDYNHSDNMVHNYAVLSNKVRIKYPPMVSPLFCLVIYVTEPLFRLCLKGPASKSSVLIWNQLRTIMS
jgi:hypothetical protein